MGITLLGSSQAPHPPVPTLPSIIKVRCSRCSASHVVGSPTRLRAHPRDPFTRGDHVKKRQVVSNLEDGLIAKGT